MTKEDKIKKAIEIFKEKLPEAKGKFRAGISETNCNVVEIFSEAGLYCTVDLRNGNIKGI